MKRILSFGLPALLAVLGWTSSASAQVFVKAPFVRVSVDGPAGPGVWVRAPFVNIYVPGGPPPVMQPAPLFAPPMPKAVDQAPPKVQPTIKNQPPANSNEQDAPQPQDAGTPLTLEKFATAFKPKAGNYEVTLINPITNEATPVRFTLPAGTPRRVQVGTNQIEFNYGPLRFVRIEFDNDGALVISR